MRSVFSWLTTIFERLTARTRRLSVRRSAMISSGIIVMVAIVFVSAIVEVGNALMTDWRGYPITNDHFSHIFIAIVVAAIIAYPVMHYSISTARMLARTKHALSEAAAEAERANAMKSTFLATTSHEIRTPLNAIIGMAEMLRRGAERPDQKQHVEILSAAAHALHRLLTDILDISKVEAGRLTVAPEPTDLHALFEEVAALWRPQAGEKRLALSLAIAPGTPRWGEVDGARVRQCIGNLVSNALKFTETGGVGLSVSAMPTEGGALVSVAVSDSGPGLSEEDQARLFQPFAQAEAEQGKRRGAGLGLAISRNLARLMGGDLALESRLGEGSCFTLSFHAAPATPARAEAAKTAAETGPLRLLVVDDTPTNLLVARLLLSAEGHEVETARSGEEALAAAAGRRFDAILLDIHMPEMDGPETLRRLRASGLGAPVIALTADAMAGDRARYVAMGMDGYAAKPLDMQALLAELARVTATVATDAERRSA